MPQTYQVLQAILIDLFGEFALTQQYTKARLMLVVDAINRIYGHDTLFFAIQGMTRNWRMRQFKLSQRFTTQWSELLTI